MVGKKKTKKEVSKLATGIKRSQIPKTVNNNTENGNANFQPIQPLVDKLKSPDNTILDPELKPGLLSKWPKLRSRVPAVFMHEIDFRNLKKIASLGIKSNNQSCNNKIKISCHTFDDHKALVQYLNKNKVPYHTFGHPSKRKMKVVIKGVPNDIDLNKIKEELKCVSIPVIRVHKMKTKHERKDNTMLLLVVVPYDDDGKRILRLNQILGHKVVLEPPNQKPSQCYRCQKWGHSQRYCHGQMKCVKCGGDHLYKKCERDPEKQPPACANCGGEHTASYKKCSHYPGNKELVIIKDITEKLTERLSFLLASTE